jgi:ATP-binding cassette, subfamily B, multidrug efflux pump
VSSYRYKRNYHKENVEKTSVDTVLIKRLLSYLRPFWSYIVISLVFLIFARAIEAFVPIYLGEISQKFLNIINSSELEKNLLLPSVYIGAFLAIGLLLGGYLFDGINVVIRSWVGQKALYALRLQVYRHLLKMKMSYFNHHSVGRLMTRTIHDVDQINQMFAESIVPIVGSIILFISIGIGVIYLDWRVAAAIAIVLPIVGWMTNHFRTNQRRCFDRVRSVVAAMNTFVQEHLMGASTIRTFGLQKKEKRRFDDINEDHCTAYQETIHHFALFIAGIDFIQNFCLIIVFVLLVHFAPPITGFQAGTYFTFSLYAIMVFRPLVDLAERYNVLQSAMAASERIFNVLDQDVEVADENKGIDLRNIETITFENVWFAYDKENWILKGLSFEINKGESFAIVGVTGAGKTTIMNLLLRFFEFQKGFIKINGVHIQEYSLNSLRKQFNVVLQDPVIFSGTIAENITLFQPDLSPEKINAVVDYANLRHIVNSFPDGLQHSLLERGKSLSLGEMQLISLARAVAHEGSVFILDEATANIDTGTERMIQDALRKILRDKTSLVIAHRLSTIKDSTNILVIHNGSIVEKGTHEQLVSLNGIYEKLYRLQYE